MSRESGLVGASTRLPRLALPDQSMHFSEGRGGWGGDLPAGEGVTRPQQEALGKRHWRVAFNNFG